jgi:hypothetical protein
LTVSAFSNYTDSSETYRGEVLDFQAIIQTDRYFQSRPDYVWTVTNANILNGQHSPSIKVETTGEPGTSVTAEVEVEGFDLSCSKRASQSVLIKQ